MTKAWTTNEAYRKARDDWSIVASAFGCRLSCAARVSMVLNVSKHPLDKSFIV